MAAQKMSTWKGRITLSELFVVVKPAMQRTCSISAISSSTVQQGLPASAVHACACPFVRSVLLLKCVEVCQLHNFGFNHLPKPSGTWYKSISSLLAWQSVMLGLLMRLSAIHLQQ
jgi:hypothetical protein